MTNKEFRGSIYNFITANIGELSAENHQRLKSLLKSCIRELSEVSNHRIAKLIESLRKAEEEIATLKGYNVSTTIKKPVKIDKGAWWITENDVPKPQ